MNSKIKFIVVFFLAAAVGFGVVLIVKQLGGKDGQESVTPSTEIIKIGEPEKVEIEIIQDTFKIVPPIEFEVIKNPIAPELVTSNVRVKLYVGKTSYYYTVKGIKLREVSENIMYTLTDSFGHKYTSGNGEFTRVDANGTGTYTVVAYDTVTGLSSELKTISGFNIIPPVANPLTASELTNIIMTGDYDGNKLQLEGKLANSLSIKCSNSDYKSHTIQEVFMSVFLDEWNIAVVSLDYNCLGQVTGVNLNAVK